jgi:CheY-specific phosphatase CheX
MSISKSSSEAVLPEQLVDCVKFSITSVFQKSFGNSPLFEKDDAETEEIGDGIVGIISYTGDITWIMMMSFPKDCAKALFTRFAGFELDYDSPDMGDVVGEMANILAGNIVGSLQEMGIKCAMSLPTLLRGFNVEPMSPRDLPSKKLVVSMPEGVVIVKVVGAKPGVSYGQVPGS